MDQVETAEEVQPEEEQPQEEPEVPARKKARFARKDPISKDKRGTSVKSADPAPSTSSGPAVAKKRLVQYTSMVQQCSITLSKSRRKHGDDTASEDEVGFSSEEEAEGLPAGSCGRRCVTLVSPVGENEVLVRKTDLENAGNKLHSLARKAGDPKVVEGPVPTKALVQLSPISDRDVKCSVCNKTFPTNSALKMHVSVHQNTPQFECSKCGKQLSNRDSLRVHLRGCGVEATIECPEAECSKKFKTQRQLQVHSKLHAPSQEKPPFPCHYCGEGNYQRKKSRDEHMWDCKENPNRRGPYFCTICGKQFPRFKLLKPHMEANHK